MTDQPLPSIRDLRPICQKPTAFETVRYARYVVRPISIYVTWLLLHTRITANQVTVLQTVFGLWGAFLIAIGSRPAGVLVGLAAMHVGYLLDCVDGEIARYRRQSSIFGVFFDYLNHSLVTPALFWGAAFFAYRSSGNVWGIFLLMTGITLLIANPTKHAVVTTVHHLFERRANPSYRVPGQRTDAPADTGGFERERGSWAFQMLQGIADYPGNMLVLSAALIVELLMSFRGGLIIGVLAAYLLMYIGREIYTFAVTVRRHRVERLYATFRSIPLSSSTPVTDREPPGTAAGTGG